MSSTEVDIHENVVSGKAVHKAVATTHQKLIFRRWVTLLAEAILNVLPSSAASVLDIGAGSGELASLLLQLRPTLQIRGLDVLVRGTTAIPVDLFDGIHIPAKDHSIDVIMLVDVLHHVAQPDLLLAECARCESTCNY